MAIAASSRTAGLSLSTALVMYVLIALSSVVYSMDRSVFSNLVSAVNSEFLCRCPLRTCRWAC